MYDSRNVSEDKDYIMCPCGAKIISNDPNLVANFDKVHGSLEHINLLLEIRMIKQDKRRVKYIFTPTEPTELEDANV